VNPTTTTTASLSLDDIATPDGTFAVVAMDQRNTLKRMFAAVDRPDTDEDMRSFKVDVAATLSPGASGILLDPTWGVPAVVEQQALAPGCGILVAAEPPSRGNLNGEPRASRDPANNAGWVKAMGGHAVKFLVQLNPSRPRKEGEPDLVEEVLDVVREVVADCRAAGVPSVVENLIYQLPGEDEPLSPEQRTDLIVESARLLDDTGADLLKLEYPGDERGCRRIAEVVTGPWAVLSAGVAFETFQDVLRISCDAGGASGFIAGRALWKEAVGMDGGERRTFLAEEGRRRLDACTEAVAGRARPWRGGAR